MRGAVQESIHNSASLKLSGFGVAYNDRVVINDATLALAGGAPMCLLGPMGRGKSTLLRAISGLRFSIPSMRTWGEGMIRGRPLGQANHAAMIAQNARLLVATVRDNLLSSKPRAEELSPATRNKLFDRMVHECGLDWAHDSRDNAVASLPLVRQRELALWRTALMRPSLLAVDEPTATLDEADRKIIIDAIRRINQWTPVFVATHVRLDVRDLGATLCVIDDGVVRNVTVGADFDTSLKFATHDDAGRSRDARSNVPTQLKYVAPPGFVWVINKRLAGCRRPGLLGDAEQEIGALGQLGIKTLIGLEESISVPMDAIRAHGIRYLHFPMPDMDAPLMAEMNQIMTHIRAAMEAGKPVAVHCRAGLGRTGTVLAAALMELEGIDAVKAVEKIRLREPLFVQSAAQLEFLNRWGEANRA